MTEQAERPPRLQGAISAHSQRGQTTWTAVIRTSLATDPMWECSHGHVDYREALTCLADAMATHRPPVARRRAREAETS